MGNFYSIPGLVHIVIISLSPVNDFISISSRRRNLRNARCSVTPKYFPIDSKTMLTMRGVGQDFVLRERKGREEFFRFIMRLHSFVRKSVKIIDSAAQQISSLG